MWKKSKSSFEKILLKKSSETERDDIDQREFILKTFVWYIWYQWCLINVIFSNIILFNTCEVRKIKSLFETSRE